MADITLISSSPTSELRKISLLSDAQLPGASMLEDPWGPVAHLLVTHGAEICLDINPPLLEKLEDIQHRFLGRLLNVGEKCLSALLFTETAIIPIKY
jgi:hypothetical protein